MTAVSVDDYRRLAKRRLPRFLFDYIDGGAYKEITLERNVRDLQDVTLHQRVLRDVSKLDLSSELFGKSVSAPFGLGPIGLAGMNARRGEVQAARAAEKAGVPFCLSTVSACPIDEVAAGTTAPFWFQLYVIRDRGFVRDMLAKAKEAGCSVLVFTVDLPFPGVRYRDFHSGLSGRKGLAAALPRIWQAINKPRWAWDVGVMGRPHQLGNVAPVLGGKSGLDDFLAWIGGNFDPSVTWKDLDFIRETWDGPMVIKGILDPDDAREAVKLGADGIVVSNHGGRQLDGAPSTARVLPHIVDAVDEQTTVLADGGVRTGLDIVRMLALGADGVLLGRAWAYALAAGGQGMVSRMIGLMKAEMRIAMALTGCTRVGDISRDNLVDI